MSEKTAKKGKYQVHIVKDRCKGCQFCVEFCPKKVLALSKDFNLKGYRFACANDSKECINCGLCEMLCPDFAVSVVPSQEG